MIAQFLKRKKYLKAMQMVRYITIVEILDVHLALYHPEHVCASILREFVSSSKTFYQCLTQQHQMNLRFSNILELDFMEEEILTIKKNTGCLIHYEMTFKTMMSLKENRTFFMLMRVVQMMQKPKHCYSAYFKDNYLDLFNLYFKTKLL